MIVLNIVLAIVSILADYSFSNLFLLFPGLLVFIVVTSKDLKSTLLQVFIFFSFYFLFFSSVSLLWTIFYLILAYIFEIILNQVSSLKFEIPFLIILSTLSYLPFSYVVHINKVVIYLDIGFWFSVATVYVLKKGNGNGKKV